jgi:hypothetical protein
MKVSVKEETEKKEEPEVSQKAMPPAPSAAEP